MVYITRRETFAASHRLYNPEWDDARNEAVYDKCANKNGHGHNYTLEVVVCGEVNPETGYLLDLKVLKQIIRDKVIREVDHKHLNFDVPFLSTVIPTAENIAKGIWGQLVNHIPAGKLYSVKLYETENNYVEYKGE